jgi:hypothetical protein
LEVNMARHVGASIAVVLTLVAAACQESPAPTDPAGPTFATDAWCAANPGKCGPPTPDEPTDPSPTSAGYWTGSTITQAKCISATGAGISDGDHDGLSDTCEDFLAQRFRPALIVSPYDCNTGAEPYWAAKAFPSKGIVRVAYLLSYYWDCGPQQSGPLCTAGRLLGTTFTLNGVLPPFTIPVVGIPISNEDLCESHQGDSEFVTVDLKYNATTQHWFVTSAFFSAHWGTSGDHSRRSVTGQLEYPDKYGGYLRVYVAEGKHGNYPTRVACENDGGQADTCASNSTVIRVRHAGQYNVGSARYNFISPKSCVRGGALVDAYPANYSLECFWDPGHNFRGWSKYALSNDASPYYTSLVVQFECYSYDKIVDSSGRTTMSCADWGANT